jgi:hypothetical protein
MSSASSAYRTWDDIRTDYTDWDDVKASNADWDAVKMKPAVDIMQGDVPILDSAELW